MYVIWRKPNDTYYYKDVKGWYGNYYIGYLNQYEHEIVCIINPPRSNRTSHKDKIKARLIRYIKNL